MLDQIGSSVVDVLQAGWSAWLWVALPVALALVALILSDKRRHRGELRRRAISDEERRAARSEDSQPAARRRLDGLVSSLDDNLGERDENAVKVLRAKLQRAGIFDRRAISWFFAVRLVIALLAGALSFVVAQMVQPNISAFVMTELVVGALGLGYFAPVIGLDRLIARRQSEYRQGFPDVMDLMIVCVQAGLSMEAGLARIAAEIRLGYPRLAENLHMATLEIRGGKPLSKAIESMAHRLGIEEALSFATLLQQSEEIGASLSQSLRAYSEDMRNKRMMKAEEKAHSLPGKLVIPLTLFIFPTLLVVIALPGAIGVANSSF
ncbi:MAG: type II secretion system F family protein [Methylobacteriaceae bacterium]|nr:type II secretion system F family protein [Methylobacteriaceae bacterium]